MTSHEMQAVHPDVFLLDQFDLYPRAVVRALAAQVSASSCPPLTPLMLLAALERCGVPRFATEVRRKVDFST